MSTFDEPITTEQLFSRTKQRKYLLIKKQAVVMVLAAVFGLLFVLKAFVPLELLFLDNWLSRAQWKTHTNVVLVPISPKSIQQIGAWPWPPAQFAAALELLSAWNARAIYIDSSLSEKWSAEEMAPLLASLEKKKIPVFFGADLASKYENTAGKNEALDLKMEWKKPPETVEKQAAFGHRKLTYGKDKVFRFWQPWLADGHFVYPVAALTMLLDLQPNFNDPSLKQLKHGEERIILWNRVHFETWQRVEFSNLVQTYAPSRDVAPAPLSTTLFNNKIVFIGLADETYEQAGLTPWRETVFPFEVMAVIFNGLNRTDKSLAFMAPFWLGAPLFLLVAVLLTLWTGMRVGMRFWLGWLGLLAFVGFVWCFFVLFRVWFPFASSALFLVLAGIALVTFESIYATGERSVLFHLATRDGLTNLYTIRHFRMIMNQITRESSMRGETAATILLDIDYFKKINDTYGHPAGDMVLKKTAEIIESSVRQLRPFKHVDFIGRYGGEEFIVLMRRMTLETAGEVAERIRSAIAQAHCEWNMQRIFITVSAGVAVLHKGENIPDSMVRRADKALYRAKEGGRNKVCLEEAS